MNRNHFLKRISVYSISVCLFTSLCITGCSAQTTADEEKYEPKHSAADKHIFISDAAELMYRPDSEISFMKKTIDKFMTKCLADKGFKYQPESYGYPSNLVTLLNEKDYPYVYSYVPPENALLYGLSLPGFRKSENIPERKIPDDYGKAYDGGNGAEISKESCVGQLLEKLLVKNNKFNQLNEQVNKILLQADEAIKEVTQKAEQKWAKCMSDSGLAEYKNISLLSSPKGVLAPEMQWSKAVTPKEIKVAQISTKCMISTGYISAVSYATSVKEHELLQKNPGLILEWKKIHDQQMKALKNFG